jgi:tRNA (cytidine/uridine-2'-O-)-methyltransferase
MFHVVLYQPEIPPNTGNIIRLCANTGVDLHLVHPLGFDLDDRQLRRAGLDYDEFARIMEYNSLQECLDNIKPTGVYAASTKGKTDYANVQYRPGDAVVFGPETSGLPRPVLDSFSPQNILRIPMQRQSRSLNLSNAVAVIIYEALRQHNFRFNEEA